MNLFITYTGGLGFLNFWSFQESVALQAPGSYWMRPWNSKQPRTSTRRGFSPPIHWCWGHSYVAQHVGQHRGSWFNHSAFNRFGATLEQNPSRTEANGGSSGVLFEGGWRITPKRVNDEVSLNHGVCVDWSFWWLRWRCWYGGGVMSLKAVLIKFQQTIVYTISGSFEAVKHVQAKFHIWISQLILHDSTSATTLLFFLQRPSDSWNFMSLDNGDFERGSQAFMFSD